MSTDSTGKSFRCSKTLWRDGSAFSATAAFIATTRGADRNESISVIRPLIRQERRTNLQKHYMFATTDRVAPRDHRYMSPRIGERQMMLVLAAVLTVAGMGGYAQNIDAANPSRLVNFSRFQSDTSYLQSTATTSRNRT